MLLVLSLMRPAEACSFIGHAPYEVDAGVQDDEPPGLADYADVAIRRGVGPQGVFVQSSTSCDDLGWIWVRVLEPEDDDPLGYRAELLEGEPPEGLSFASEPFSLLEDGGLQFVWIDEATDIQEPFDMVVGLTAVDPAGNEGPTLEIPLSDGGSRCATVRGGPWLLGLLALLWRR